MRGPIVRFGVFEVDSASAELRKQGAKVRLQQQPFRVLLELLARPGEVVSRDELRTRLWPDTVVDFDRGLNKAINRLREALGDDADSPRFIETLPQRGYRFLAPVEVVESSLEPLPDAALPSGRARWRWIVVALAAGAIGLGWTAGRRSQPRPAPSALRFEVAPPEGYAFEPAGTRQAFAVSPDGGKLAFTAVNDANVYSAWIKDFSSPEPRQVHGSEGAHNVFWSPDSVSLLSHIRGALRRSAGLEGFHHVITSIPAGIEAGAWLPDGNILLSGRRQSFIAPATGGAPRSVEGRVYRWPQALPDHGRVLFVEQEPETLQYAARVATPGGPEADRVLLKAESRVAYAPSMRRRDLGYLLFVKAGNLLAQPVGRESLDLVGEPLVVASQVFTFRPSGSASFSVSENGVLAYQRAPMSSRIAWVDRSGREIQAITPGNLAVKYVRLSPDESRIAAVLYDVEKGSSDVWTFNVDGGAARRVVVGGGLADSPIWSPDSKRIALVRAASRGPEVFVADLAGQGAEQASPLKGFQIPTDWSPDGRYLAFADTAFPHIENDQGGDVWLVDLEQTKVVPILKTPYREASAAFAPNGKLLAFIADDSGRPEAYVQSFENGNEPRLTGERRQVSRGGAFVLRWRADGEELFYLDANGNVCAVRIGPNVGEPERLFAIPVESRAVLPLASAFDVSRDGSRFLVAMARTHAPLSVLHQWEALLSDEANEP